MCVAVSSCCDGIQIPDLISLKATIFIVQMQMEPDDHKSELGQSASDTLAYLIR